MNYFLAKTEPASYSIDDLQRDGQTTWDGVKNAQAVRAIREMRPGDRVFLYHTGDVSAIAGLAQVISAPADDPKDSKSAVVDLQFLKKIEPPVALGEIKATGRFADWALVRQGRLSTMRVPPEFVEWMRAQGRL